METERFSVLAESKRFINMVRAGKATNSADYEILMTPKELCEVVHMLGGTSEDVVMLREKATGLCAAFLEDGIADKLQQALNQSACA